MGDLVDRGSRRSMRMMADAESNSTKRQRAIWMRDGDEDSAKAALRPRDVGLDTAAKPGAVASFYLAGHQARFRDSSKSTRLLTKRAQCLLSTRRQMREVFLQSIVVKADRKDRLRLRFDHPQPSSSAGSDPNWRSNSCESSRCSP